MRKLVLLSCLALAACGPNSQTTPVSSLPVASTVCPQISLERLDTALKAYDVAIDAVNMLIDVKVITPGSDNAKKIASANDAIIAGFQAADAARAACNATSYTEALANINSGIDAVRSALPHK